MIKLPCRPFAHFPLRVVALSTSYNRAMTELPVAIPKPDKVLFPGPGFTKRDLAEYYLAVAPAQYQAKVRSQRAAFRLAETRK